MCLILFAYRAHPDYPLLVAANRDEFFGRPTQPAEFWPEAPHLLAGRDLSAGGTWLGVTTAGRFAAITNFRQPGSRLANARSRGELTRDFLMSDERPDRYAEVVLGRANQYHGFNLLVGDGERLLYCSNRASQLRELQPGIYGLSNHLLDTPWPKVERGKQALQKLLSGPVASHHLLDFLADPNTAPDCELPQTGVSLEQERTLSAAFIRGENYGTCCSTALIVNRDGRVSFHERSFYPQPGGKENTDAVYQFTIAT